MRILLALCLSAVASAESLYVRVELDGGVCRDILVYEKGPEVLRARIGSTDTAEDPARWDDVKLTSAAGEKFEALLAAEDAWALTSEEAALERAKVASYPAACRISLESGGGKRVKATKRPYSAFEDTKFGRIARGLAALARPAPAGRGIEVSYVVPIMDSGYTLTLSADGPKFRTTLQPHKGDGTLAEAASQEMAAEDFEAAWKEIESRGPWTMGDATAAEGDEDRYEVRLWKDGVEHRFRVFRQKAVGGQPQKYAIAGALKAKGVPAFLDGGMSSFRSRQQTDRIDRLYRDWATGSPEVREDAERSLAEIAAAAMPRVRELLEAESRDDVKRRGAALIERLERGNK